MPYTIVVTVEDIQLYLQLCLYSLQKFTRNPDKIYVILPGKYMRYTPNYEKLSPQVLEGM